jgi:hypothetical protein
MDNLSRLAAQNLHNNHSGFHEVSKENASPHMRYLLLCGGFSPGGMNNEQANKFCSSFDKLAKHSFMTIESLKQKTMPLAVMAAMSIAKNDVGAELDDFPTEDKRLDPSWIAMRSVMVEYISAYQLYINLLEFDAKGIIPGPYNA